MHTSLITSIYEYAGVTIDRVAGANTVTTGSSGDGGYPYSALFNRPYSIDHMVSHLILQAMYTSLISISIRQGSVCYTITAYAVINRATHVQQCMNHISIIITTYDLLTETIPYVCTQAFTLFN